MTDPLVFAGACAVRELTIFAAVGFLIGGFGDLVIDLLWLGRTFWRRVTVYRTHPRMAVSTLPPPDAPGRIAIFLPAWDESAVIGPMLRHALRALGDGDWRLYIGVYPNDPATIAAVDAIGSARIRMVIGAQPGPTTKADCLNGLWRALLADEQTEGQLAKAIVLHDAEDVIHSAEVRLFDAMIERFDLVQLPVLPLIDRRSRLIAGHYNDEFSESHGKTIVVREMLGAAIPAAGVGCAFARAMLGRIAGARGGQPFDADSLTEDYELGLTVAAMGGRSAFVRMPAVPGGPVVAVRAHFPATLEASVRQKARWMVGIALSGWDRMGWRGGLAERWMRLHDRRALLSALVLLAAYAALVLGAVVWMLAAVAHLALPAISPAMVALLTGCALLMLWRLVMRVAFVTRDYGWFEGLCALPRAIVANVIAMMAARRAVGLYRRMRRDGVVRWDKTAHHFPTIVPAE